MENVIPEVTDCLQQLSRRELQVAYKIMEGLPNKRIATQLFISERTVKFHCANIYRKLDIHNRTSLMANYYSQIYEAGRAQDSKERDPGTADIE